MPSINPRSLIEKLNTTCHRSLDAAAGLCLSHTHFSIEIEHWFIKLCDNSTGDFAALFQYFKLDPAKVKQQLESSIRLFKTGNSRAPSLAVEVFDLVREAWVLASLEYGSTKVRSGHLLVAALTERTLALHLKSSSQELGRIPPDRLLNDLRAILDASNSDENAEEAAAAAAAATAGTTEPDGTPRAAANSKTPNLDQYTHNLTAQVKQGKIDKILGRDAEIRQVIDILTRRRQNNPILTGEAGVGKTAVVEGLAVRIVAGDVPEPLRNVELRTLDLGLLQAGAGMKGEFENRLKSVIQEVKSSPVPIILFIDEAHTMIGAGGQAGQNDAANLLKPALARGELRTVAATTFDEYKKYFESDPALKRRFQEVRVEEPDEARAIRMMRAVVGPMEKHHKVRILDEAVVESVRLSIRYLPERQLPDKAVSLLDTASARVKLSQGATPPALEDVIREIEHFDIEIASINREQNAWENHDARLAELTELKKTAEEKRDILKAQLEKERDLVGKIRQAVEDCENPEPEKSAGKREELIRLRHELAELQGENPLVLPVVDGGAISQIVGGWTGIPIGKMVRNEIELLLHLDKKIGERVIGQDHALGEIAERIRTARAELGDPRRPVGVFLLVGPSGVGKTETAMVLADLLYGGDRNMVVVNMSEFKEEYKVSQLIGSPRGYEGSSEGGVLTEAVRRKPYSVVLLDEVEKAHPSVQEIFYQVFDKGMLTDSRGIEVNFKNTIILLTSNVGTATVQNAFSGKNPPPDPVKLGEMLRPDLLKAFKPALLGRMSVVPYLPLSDTVLKSIIELQLKKIRNRLLENHKATFEYDPKVVEAIAARCKEVESGARNVDHILTKTVLPAIASEILSRKAENRSVAYVKITTGDDGAFQYSIE